MSDLIQRLQAAADEAQGDHEDDVARIADMDGPIAGAVAEDEPVEVVLSLTTVRRCIEALTAPPQPTEGEWVLVPREPTEEMCSAFVAAEATSPMMDPLGAFEDAYRAMIQAAPPQPHVAPEGEGNSVSVAESGSALHGAHTEAEPSGEEGFSVFMCKTDFDHDVRDASDGARAFPSESAVRRERPCVAECGIVEVRMTLVRVVQDPDWGDFTETSQALDVKP